MHDFHAFLRWICVATAIVLGGLAGPGLADEWSLSKVRGIVEIEVDGTWQGVSAGATVPDGVMIRTGFGARARLTRGAEWIELKSMTSLVIHDRDGQRFTTVVQMAGDVEVEAEALNVQHFAVDTPYLAAVVKGTHFTVSVRRGRSSVNVDRGVVEVDTRHGQTFAVPKGSTIGVTGDGTVNGTATRIDKQSTSSSTDDGASGDDDAGGTDTVTSSDDDRSGEDDGEDGSDSSSHGSHSDSSGHGSSGHGSSGHGSSDDNDDEEDED